MPAPKGCAEKWNAPCGARQCTYPYCRDASLTIAQQREAAAKERREAAKQFTSPAPIEFR
jgi:hypothetical protein